MPPLCSVISADEAGAALGDRVSAEPYYGTDCAYDLVDGLSGVDGIGFRLSVYNPPEGGCDELLDVEKNLESQVITPVDGFGDRAQWVETPDTGMGAFEVCRGRVYVNVSLDAPSATTSASLREIAEKLTGLVLDRL